MRARSTSHHIEEKAEKKFGYLISDENIVYRNITGRDYGIDGILELFEDGNPTGRIAFIQIKGTANKIVPLKKSPEVSCNNVTRSNLMYAKQKNIPIILIYLNINDEFFYDKWLNEISPKKVKDRNVIRIHIENYIDKDIWL